MKKDSTRKDKKKSLYTSNKDTFISSLYNYITNNFSTSLGVFVAVAVLILSYTLYQYNSNPIKNLINADISILKDAVFGDEPYLFYCNRNGANDHPPPIYLDLNKIRGSKVSFAMINCSQILPSGKTFYERLKLKKEIKPTIFGTAPWLKPKQVMPENLKDINSFKKFIDVSMAPRATAITNDKDLQNFCGYNKNVTKDINSVGPTCIVLIKGSRYNSKSHGDLEAQIVKENPKLKIAIVDGSKRRFSFENPSLLPYDSFALKAYGIRNGTHYQTMVNPLTYDYLTTFISKAVGSPLYDYQGDGNEPVSLLKLSSPVFTRKSQDNDDDDEDSDNSNTKKKSKSSKRKPKNQNKEYKSNTKSDSSSSSSNSNDDEYKKEKERIKRENMDRQSKSRLYDEEETVEYEDNDNEEEDDEIIEL